MRFYDPGCWYNHQKEFYVPVIVVGTAVPAMIVGTAVPSIDVLMAYYWKSCDRDPPTVFKFIEYCN